MSKISTISRITQFRPGSGISRAYNNAKHAKALYTGFAGVEFLIAMCAASNHHTFNTLFTGALTMYFTKKAVKFHNLKNSIAGEYQDIVDRAKQIYKKAK